MSHRLRSILLGITIRTHRSIPPHLICRAWFCSGRFRNQTHMENHASCEAVVGDSELLDKKRAAICNAGPAKLQVDKNSTIEGGLTYDGIRQSVAYSTIAVVELFEFLEERDIPVLIFSAGLADIIEDVLRRKIHRLFKNVKIVSNRMVFDNNGHLASPLLNPPNLSWSKTYDLKHILAFRRGLAYATLLLGSKAIGKEVKSMEASIIQMLALHKFLMSKHLMSFTNFRQEVGNDNIGTIEVPVYGHNIGNEDRIEVPVNVDDEEDSEEDFDADGRRRFCESKTNWGARSMNSRPTLNLQMGG
ncbi:hypothetical protein Pyn_29418 [Prunus yedoensis var. nudiflora]|uniref:5'-nucleotidase n=1 Tax=Prunus yedoensis var. nudiflora TaxID=2094558 RepID=A0A314XVD5_PRUYE|nr:hypothetical protein Pyn_29418 [Prunus yedoensis var. nudiflora]